jgi:hypothetical protein
VWLVGLLLAAAPDPVGIAIVEAGEVTGEETAALLAEIDAAVLKVGRDPQRLGASDPPPEVTLEIRVLGAVRYLRVEIERRGPGPGAPRAEVDLRREPDLWPVELERMMISLLGPPSASVAIEAPPTIPPPPEDPSVAPFVLAGVGVAALAIGIGFGISSASARNNSERPEISDAEFEDYADRTQAHAIVADIGFIVAAVSALGAGAWWAIE